MWAITIESLSRTSSRKSLKLAMSTPTPSALSKACFRIHTFIHTCIHFSHHFQLFCSIYLVVVLNEADSLSQTAQASLRRTMEKYIGNMRVIMCCNSTAKIIDPIRSRCLLIRVPAPNIEEVEIAIIFFNFFLFFFLFFSVFTIFFYGV